MSDSKRHDMGWRRFAARLSMTNDMTSPPAFGRPPWLKRIPPHPRSSPRKRGPRLWINLRFRKNATLSGPSSLPNLGPRFRGDERCKIFSNHSVKRLPVVVLSLGLCGCVSLFPKATPVQLYEFGQRPPPASSPSGAGPTKVGAVGVVLGTIAMPAAAVGDQMLSVTGQQAAYIGGARWVVPAGLMIQGDAERAFEAQGQRVRLLHRGDIGAAAALLRLDVGDFAARYDAPGAVPTVIVSVRASLTRPGGALIAEQTLTARQPAADNRIAPIVAAYDKAVIDVLDQVVAWTDANAPAAAPEPRATTQTVSTTSTSSVSTTTQAPH